MATSGPTATLLADFGQGVCPAYPAYPVYPVYPAAGESIFIRGAPL